MPTLEALETAVSDYKRAQEEFDSLRAKQAELLAELGAIQRRIATAKASFDSNEDALRTVAVQFAKG